MARLRVGVVLLVPPPARAEIDGLRRGLGDGRLDRVPPHLTLVPPVNLRDDRLMDALDVVRAAAAATRPFTVSLGPPATFNPATPVVHLPVADIGTGPAAVVAVRDRVFVPPLARELTWPFVPHVTLAEDLPADRIAAAIAALASYRIDVTFDRVHLLEEAPGQRWAPMADAAFDAPAVIGRGGLPLELSTSEEPDLEARAFADREWPLHDARELGSGVEWREDRIAITARREGQVVGLARGWTAGGIGYLSGLIVGAGQRGQGIGSHLLAAFASLAAERGCRRLALRTFSGTAAEAFYRSRGWVDEARFSPWIHGRDMVQLRRDL